MPRKINLRIKGMKNILLVGWSRWNFYCSRTKVQFKFQLTRAIRSMLFTFLLSVCVFHLNLAHLSGDLVRHHFKDSLEVLQITSRANGGHDLARGSSHQSSINLWLTGICKWVNKLIKFRGGNISIFKIVITGASTGRESKGLIN